MFRRSLGPSIFMHWGAADRLENKERDQAFGFGKDASVLQMYLEFSMTRSQIKGASRKVSVHYYVWYIHR